MRKQILVPLDGSLLADRVVAMTRRLLVQEDTEVALVRVLTSEDVERAGEAVARAREHLERLRDSLSRQGGRVRCDTITGGDSADEILRYAAEMGPSLIVLATHGRTGNARWIRGSVAERVLRRTEHPLLLVNPFTGGDGAEARTLDFRRILVPLDGTEVSAKILPLVANLATVCGSEVVLLHVLEPGKGGATATTRAEADLMLKNRHGKQLDRISLRTLAAEGAPAAAILDAVEAEGADVVAMTTHGQGKSSKWVFGTVAEQVLGHCPVPLLVYRTAGFAEGSTRHVRP